MLLNLLSNAVKFTDQGEITLRCLAAEDTVVFEVIDTGIGISSEEHANIFGSFYQVQDQADREYTGTGLGLALAKRYVEFMGGSLAVTSSPGEGSTFRTVLPVGAAQG